MRVEGRFWVLGEGAMAANSVEEDLYNFLVGSYFVVAEGAAGRAGLLSMKKRFRLLVPLSNVVATLTFFGFDL